MELDVPRNAVVVVAGVPGAGKTTLIDRAADRRTMRVVDTEDQRRAGRRRPKAVRIVVHYARIVVAVLGSSPAVIHSRGTTTLARRAIALLARLRGRPAHLVLLVASPEQAVAGQRSRGRTIAGREMAGHVERFARLAAQPPERVAAAEGWATVHRVDRAQASLIRGFFAPRAALGPAMRSLPAA